MAPRLDEVDRRALGRDEHGDRAGLGRATVVGALHAHAGNRRPHTRDRSIPRDRPLAPDDLTRCADDADGRASAGQQSARAARARGAPYGRRPVARRGAPAPVRYDVVIDGKITRGASFVSSPARTMVTGARYRIGVGGGNHHLVFNICVSRFDRTTTHMVEGSAALALPFGVDMATTNWRPEIFLSSASASAQEPHGKPQRARGRPAASAGWSTFRRERRFVAGPTSGGSP